MSVIGKLFKSDKIIRPSVGHRVRHRDTGALGTVIGSAKIVSGGVKVGALTVQYDDGRMAIQVPEQEFTVVGGTRL